MSIWKHKELKNEFQEKFLVTLGEGDTPLEKLEDNSNLIFIKREDLNPTGSWKDRGTAYKMSELVANNYSEAVISSTGNAAISFLTYANHVQNFKFHIVVSPEIAVKKRKLIEGLAGDLHEVHYEKFAKQASSKISAAKKIPILRSSTDNNIVKGYWTLGFELVRIVKHSQEKNIFLVMAASSGTAAVGVAQGLMMKLDNEFLMPRFIITQTTKCHPVLQQLNKFPKYQTSESSLADGISNESMLRMPQIVNIINNTNGDGIAISDSELIEAENFCKVTKNWPKTLTYNSLLSVAAYLKIRKQYSGSIFILITSGR